MNAKSSFTTPPSVATDRWPTSARIAGLLLLLVGVLTVLAGGLALAAGNAEIRTPVAVGLLAAGLATVVVGWLTRRGNHVALYLALVVFEVLLIARLVTPGANTGSLVVSLVLLVVLVAVLWWAAIEVRRQRRAAKDPA